MNMLEAVPDMAELAVLAARETGHTHVIYHDGKRLWMSRATTFEELKPGLGIARVTRDSNAADVADEARKWL